MKTSDERREVAERLRELPSHADADGCCTVWDVLFALGLKQCDVIGFVRADDAQRLADLIDHPRKGRKPCAHGDVCRAYMRERGVILRDTCPDCEHYEPRGD